MISIPLEELDDLSLTVFFLALKFSVSLKSNQYKQIKIFTAIFRCMFEPVTFLST
jgi:hypothetical protein